MLQALTTDIAPQKPPWWAWLLTIVILHTGSQISLLFEYSQGVTDYYLPTALSLILINWWGPRIVLPILYINATLSTYLWGVPLDQWYEWPIYALPETCFTFLGWLLFRKMYQGKYWLPDIRNLLAFLFLGTVVPLFIEILGLQLLLSYFGEQSWSTFWPLVRRNALGEFTSSFGLALPLLYYGSHYMQKAGLLYEQHESIPSSNLLNRNQRLELIGIYIILLLLVFNIDFEKFWYIYGLLSLYIAIRFGFGPVTFTNYYIFLITYIIPRLFTQFGYKPFSQEFDVTNILLGASLLLVFAAVVGRVITDLKIAEIRLQQQNQELDQINKELDRFVYSVSHDLTAPLKSILGLVNISRIAHEPKDVSHYLSRIEQSVRKLEIFISEVLDYSKNKRQEVNIERIKLLELCTDILGNLKNMEGFSNITIDLSNLKHEEINQDKMRLSIILNNLLTNAIKFQKRLPEHQPYIRVSTRKSQEKVIIEIEDNGEGIPPGVQDKIFDMFYRGTENSSGSGLGLYIARETASKIDGNIYVQSEYGKGSVFIVELKELATKSVWS
ncbi:MAG TPA: HAMP domain-containing sensor histidine kinase [Ohtaekwangia sp.]|uniref:HAMP domain-containing sensor histidine kinase n=1 Tax=Ohtaekwangia sp. TaxID=2066019 RepID=UPI002F923890